MTNQSDRQASVRAVTGTTSSYEGDFHALFDAAGIPVGDFNSRLLAWINARLGSSYTEINGAMAAFAVDQGASSWDQLGTFDATGATFGVLLAGQSNAENRNTYAASNFSNEINSLITNGDIEYIEGATSGSQMLKANGGNYWYDNDTSTPNGPALVTCQTAEAAYNGPVNAVIMDQGESDYITLFAATYQTGARSVCASLNTLTGADIFVTIPHSTSNNGGNAWDGSTIDGSVQMIREAWWAIQADTGYVKSGSERFDLPESDSQHLTVGGYQTLAVRDARLIAKSLGYTVTGSTLGPQITNVSRSGAVLTVTIAHDGGTDFTPTTAIQGFYFTDNGSSIGISSAVRTNATTITVTLASTPTGTKVLYYVYGRNNGISDKTKIIHDNSPQSLPLRASKWSVA